MRTVKPVTGIKGMDIVLSNYKKEMLKIKGRSMKGMIEAAMFIRRDMEEKEPKIPVDTGNLRASWFVVTIRQSVHLFGVLMGFAANYAMWVHEMVGADFTSPRFRYGKGKKKKYWYTPRAGAGAKFFEAALKRNTQHILAIIRKNAIIKK